MKIFGLLSFLSIQSIFGSGCGGFHGYEVTNLKVLEKILLTKEDFRVIGKDEGFVKVIIPGHTVTLIHGKGSGEPSLLKVGDLLLERITYDEYDGCDSYISRRTDRVSYKTRDNTVYSFPLVFEYRDRYEAAFTYYPDGYLHIRL